MCDRCRTGFVIHNGRELYDYLSRYRSQPDLVEHIIALWAQRGYFDNLVYLEYLIYERERFTTR